MIRRIVCVAAFLSAVALAALPARSAEAEPQAAPPESAEQRSSQPDGGVPPLDTELAPGATEALLADSEQPVVYVPPRRGAPATRVGGGTRSAAGAAPQVLLLSPEHTGLTSRPAPTLYWFLSRDYEGPVELVVTARDAVQPLLRERIHTRFPAGFHELDLAGHGVTLDPERLYQWSVSLVRDEQRRSRDVVAVATIERVSLAVVPQQLAGLAEAGLWYDAIDALGQTIPLLPDQRLTRADLLDQVGLTAAAEWDRRI